MNTFVFLGVIGGYEWILIVVIVVLLFGGKKIPELMKGMGQGIKEFKQGMKDTGEDKKTDPKNQPPKELN